MKAACAFREGASNRRKERACPARDFRARLSRTLRRIARMLQALSGRGRAIAEKNAPVRRWIFAQGKPRIPPHCLKAACAFRVGGEQLPKRTRLYGDGFSRKARRQGEGVLEVRRAADDTALREKTSRPGAGFLAIARWGKAPFSERRPPPAFPPFLPHDAIRARELSPRALFLTCIG